MAQTASDSREVKMSPARYDTLIRHTQRDQLAIGAALLGFLVFFLFALFTREGGLAVYKQACWGTILFGVGGWVLGHFLLVVGRGDRPVFLDAGEEAGMTRLRELPLDEVRPGMVLAAPVTGLGGVEFLPSGTVLDENQVHALERMEVDRVLVRVTDSRGGSPASH